MRIAVAFASVAMVWSASGTAHAWECLTGSCPVWCAPAPYGLTVVSPDLGDATTEAEVQRGMNDWTLRSCTSLQASYTGRSGATAGAGDGQSMIGWVESGWRHGSGAIGVTGPRWNGRNCIQEADMEMNGVNFTWTTAAGAGSRVNTYSIVLHEGGHYYGLGHSNDRNATMYFAYTGGIDSINADDEGGICTLYPGDGPVDCSVSGCPTGQECVDNTCRPIMGDGTVCSPCNSDAECGGPNDFCIGYPTGGQFCGRACSGGSDCGDGFICAGTTGGVSQCAGFDGSTFSCDGAMPSGCTNDSDCAATERCNTSTGNCEPRPMDRNELGEPCTDNDECNSGLCAATADGQVCSQSCDSFNPMSCPGGFYCDGDGCGTGLCVGGSAGAAGLGASCSTDTDCSTLLCDGGVCATPCRPDAEVNTCGDGFVCRASANPSCGACRSEADLGQLGDDCTINADCASGTCAVRGGGDNFCTEFCSDASDCGGDFTCVPVSEDASVCTPSNRGGGCGCAAPGAPSDSTPWGACALVLGLAAWRRQRRR